MPVDLHERPAKPHVKVRYVHLDYETYSEADLPKVGQSVYAQHPSTEVLMLAYAGPKGEVYQWVPDPGLTAAELRADMPEGLRRAFADPNCILLAWNAPFEMAITKHVLGLDIPVSRWRDVMALAYSLSLPGKLEKAGKVVGLPEEQAKIARGKLLVRRFCQPRKPSKYKPWTRCNAETDPEDWQEFLEYNRRDVVAERAIWKKLKPWMLPDHEWALWHLDQKINNAGIPINHRAVEAARRLARVTIKKDLARMAEITGLANPNSRDQLLPWLRANGYPYEDLKKGHVERAYDAAVEMLDSDLSDLFGITQGLVDVLRLRLRVSKASVKKFEAVALALDLDGNLRGCHQYAGAGRTWRWSGRRFQPQNLPKPSRELETWALSMTPTHDEDGRELEDHERAIIAFERMVRDLEEMDPEEIELLYDNPMEMLTACVRPIVQAPEGTVLLDADLSAIENVVLGWLAQDDLILSVFREGRDPYIDFATRMFKMSYADIMASPNKKKMRTLAKPGVLGCGYMLGAGEVRENRDTGELEATGLTGYGWNMGVDLTPEMAQLSVETFRSTYKKVVNFWWDLDRAFRAVISTGKPQRVGYLKFDRSGPFVRIILPSGRALHYCNPKLIRKKTPWGEMKWQVSYEQVENQQWRRVTTHPGKIAENVTQAVARDILANGMTLADAQGIDIRLHVHDQIVAVSPEARASRQLALLKKCMTALPGWADDSLPLKAAGFASPVFIKD